MAVIARAAASVLLLVGALVLVAAVPSAPAGASCIGPTLEPMEPVEPLVPVVRGATMKVSGIGFGTECYDTGPPPEGVGGLGPPIRDIEVLLVQDGNEVVVARGSADAEYEIDVDVTVPPRLAPGPARVVARWDAPGSGGSTEQAIEVSADQPASEPSGTTPVASFGPSEAVLAAADERSADAAATAEDDPSPLVRGVAAIAVVVLASIPVVLRRRRRAAPSSVR